MAWVAPNRIERRLTGNVQHQTSRWLRRQVLYVEVGVTSYPGFDFERKQGRAMQSEWRPATELDLFELQKLEAHHKLGVPYIPQPGAERGGPA